MKNWIVSWKQEIEMTLRRSWQMRLPEICLSYSRRLWQDWKWKLFLASESETQGLLSLPILHSGICSHVPSSSNQ